MVINLTRYLFKVVICGAGGVGKTSLFNRFLSNSFNQKQLMTMGINYATYYIDLKEGRVDLQLWDFGGQMEFRHLLPKFLEGTSGVILVFDLTRYSSFLQLDEWDSIFSQKFRKKIPILLVGSKVDLCDENPLVQSISDQQILEYANKHQYLDFIKTSAKIGKNTRECFEIIARAMYLEIYSK